MALIGLTVVVLTLFAQRLSETQGYIIDLRFWCFFNPCHVFHLANRSVDQAEILVCCSTQKSNGTAYPYFFDLKLASSVSFL